jgi:hypothetical protein
LVSFPPRNGKLVLIRSAKLTLGAALDAADVDDVPDDDIPDRLPSGERLALEGEPPPKEDVGDLDAALSSFLPTPKREVSPPNPLVTLLRGLPPDFGVAGFSLLLSPPPKREVIPPRPFVTFASGLPPDFGVAGFSLLLSPPPKREVIPPRPFVTPEIPPNPLFFSSSLSASLFLPESPLLEGMGLRSDDEDGELLVGLGDELLP